MIVNKANIQCFFVNLKTTFQGALSAAPTQWQKVAMRITSNGRSNNYAWLSRFPAMQKWVGEKVIKKLAAFNYTVVNDDWEVTIEVDRNDLDDDETGQFAIQARSAGESAAQLPDDIVFELINNGFESVCYDGQYFFDTDHPVGRGVVSNKGTKKLSCETLAEAKASYGVARTTLRKIQDDEGRALNVKPNILLVPVALEDVAVTLMTTEKFSSGERNIYRGTAEVVVEPRLTDDNKWFLLDTTKPITPFFYQERKAPVMVEQTDMSADDVFMRKKFKFGAEARAAGGYGLWQLAYGSTGEED